MATEPEQHLLALLQAVWTVAYNFGREKGGNEVSAFEHGHHDNAPPADAAWVYAVGNPPRFDLADPQKWETEAWT